MKVIKTHNFIKQTSSLETWRGYERSQNNNQQSVLRNKHDRTEKDIIENFDEDEILPSEQVYQEGVRVPAVKRNPKDD